MSKRADSADQHYLELRRMHFTADDTDARDDADGAGSQHHPAAPMTRREALRLERAAAASVADATSVADAETIARSEASVETRSADSLPAQLRRLPLDRPLVVGRGFSHRRATAVRLRDRRSTRITALSASIASLGLVFSVMLALPAEAATPLVSETAVQAVLAAHGNAQKLQDFTVSAEVDPTSAGRDDPVASALSGIISSQGGAAGTQAASAISTALQEGGLRERIVATALTYLGDPYQMDGDTHAGIDCSGLIMVSYAQVGIKLAHLVSAQDAAGVEIPESQAQPGDLVVFNDHEHVGMYLGGGVLIQAPTYGVPVQITTVWAGIPHHFTRILPAGD